jgi:cytochrome c peroxidase
MSRGHWVACAACHLDGGADARTWAGFPDGPRATPALFDAAATLPLHWNGNLDELQDVENTIRNVQFGEGLIAGAAHPNLGPSNGGRSAALDALAAYLGTLAAPTSPYAPADAAATEAVARGERAFRRWGCAACHTPPLFTDRERHPAEFGDPAGRFDTPSLRGVWATAPYFHDGSALTLREALFAQGFHSMGYAMDAREVDDLLAYLRALP